jgi:hypothetical protein
MSTMFETPTSMENASVMLGALRGELERVGRIEEARTLKGLEVMGPDSLHIALMTVRQLKADGELDSLRGYVTEALESALKASSTCLAC